MAVVGEEDLEYQEAIRSIELKISSELNKMRGEYSQMNIFLTKVGIYSHS